MICICDRNKENPTLIGRMINFTVMLFEKLVLFINKNAYILIGRF